MEVLERWLLLEDAPTRASKREGEGGKREVLLSEIGPVWATGSLGWEQVLFGKEWSEEVTKMLGGERRKLGKLQTKEVELDVDGRVGRELASLFERQEEKEIAEEEEESYEAIGWVRASSATTEVPT